MFWYICFFVDTFILIDSEKAVKLKMAASHLFLSENKEAPYQPIRHISYLRLFALLFSF